MIAKVELPDYDGNAIDAIWNDGSYFDIRIDDGSVYLSANSQGLISLAYQMLYMAYNDMSPGSHILYDGFLTGIPTGDYELCKEKKENNP